MNKRRARRIDNNLYILLLSLPILIMKEEYGWGSKKRLPDLSEKLCTYLKRIETGDLPVHEVVAAAEQLSGVKLIDPR